MMMTRSASFGLMASAIFAVFAFDHGAQAAAPSPATVSQANSANVILLTLDGVRWEEVFHGVDAGLSIDPNSHVFDFLTGPLSKQGVLYGDRRRGETVRVANRPQNSLPGYQSIMAGATQPCGSNLCGRIRVETFPERLVHDLGLSNDQVATISSWEKIAHAVEHVEHTTYVNAGDRPLLVDGDALSTEDAKLNQLQAQDLPPWRDARWDKYTFGHAMNYLKAKHPRFLFISLNDSDEWGHKGEYDQYLKTLRQHDAWIQELVATLDSLGEYGKNTTLIITTDHGRGDGNGWDDHGAGIADSANVWLYGRSPYTQSAKPQNVRVPAAQVVYSHLDIRPTIEATFGLEPKLDGISPLPGHVINSIVGSPNLRETASAPATPVHAPARAHAKAAQAAHASLSSTAN